MVRTETWIVIGLTARAKKVHVLLSSPPDNLPRVTHGIDVEMHAAPSLYSKVTVTYEWGTEYEERHAFPGEIDTGVKWPVN